MTDMEQRLTEHLHRRAAEATPRFDLDAVERGARAVPRLDPPHRDHPTSAPVTRRGRWIRPLVLGAAAALLIAIVGVAATRDERVAVAPTTPRAGDWVAQAFSSSVWITSVSNPWVSAPLDGRAGRRVCPAFSPDGERLMFGRLSEGVASLEILDVAIVGEGGGVDGGEGRGAPLAEADFPRVRSLTLEDVEGIPCAIWGPDGRWAALASGGAVLVVDTETGEVRRIPGYEPTDLEWRPGTDELAIAGRAVPGNLAGDNAPITIYSLATGDLRVLGDVEANRITWSPDGTTIAFTETADGNATSGIWLIDAGGSNRRQLTSDRDPIEHGLGITWSPAGDRIAYQRPRTGCEGDACHERSEVVLVTATDADPANPMGAVQLVDPVVDNLDIEAFDELYNHPPPFRTEDWHANSVTWSPDGTALLYTAGSAGLLVVPTEPGRPVIVLSGDGLIGADDEDATIPWLPLQQWQPRP